MIRKLYKKEQYWFHVFYNAARILVWCAKVATLYFLYCHVYE
jgi:hypothetical protein